MAQPISVIVPTYNEEVNIEHCLKSVCGWARELIVVDSFSTDRTLEIVRQYTSRIHQHAFENHGKQMNWALANVPIAHEWILQLDADEMVTPELAEELQVVLPALAPEVTGLYAKRRVYFLGRWMKHGDYYPLWFVRIFRKGKARYEDFEEDRVILLEGRAERLRHDFIDYNRNGLFFWTQKHNQWAANFMQQLLSFEKQGAGFQGALTPALFSTQDRRRRWLTQNVYVRLPLFLRAFVHFFYRYFFRFGFLDGTEGLIFHFLQGCWYRFYVDAHIYEYRKAQVEERKG